VKRKILVALVVLLVGIAGCASMTSGTSEKILASSSAATSNT
jgi:uncharacterized protein YceK